MDKSKKYIVSICVVFKSIHKVLLRFKKSNFVNTYISKNVCVEISMIY